MLADFRSAPTPTLQRLALSLLAIAVSLPGQEGPAPAAPADPEPTSRAEAIEQARSEKAKNLTKPVAGKIEKVMHRVEDTNYLERLTAGLGGLSGRFGGLATGQGFALGPGYVFRAADGDLKVSTFAIGSAKKAYQFEVLADLPNIAGGKFPVHLAAVHSNYPEMDYYGPGPDSRLEGESAYRLERTSFDADAAFKPADFVRLGLTGGYLQFNVGPGPPGDDSTDQVYGPEVTPGILRQTDFWRAGGFVEVDYRDIVGGPRSGGFYSARFLYYDDQRIDLHTFRRLDLEVQQYIPFFNDKRVFALRGRTAMTWSIDGQSVPFYMQPYLGGSEDLRGFRTYRFYDDNHVILNAEYRWESFPGLDMALFFDAGKVTPRRTQINFHGLETSYGIGFRFNGRNKVFLRLDFGFSREGYQIWFIDSRII